MGRPPNTVAERAASLCEFLAELQELRTTPIRSVESYRSVLWYADLPRDPHLGWPEGDDPDESFPWLTATRIEREAPPEPPPSVRPWLPEQDLWDFAQAAPRLRQAVQLSTEIVDADGGRTIEFVERRLEDDPSVTAEYDAWLPTWQDWAAGELARDAVVRVYQRLYAIYQDLTENPEVYELVLAYGYLTWRSGGTDVRRHLVTIPAAVTLDQDSGQLTVVPGDDTDEPRLEEDMLNEADRLREPQRRAVVDILRAEGRLWGRDSLVEPAVARWVNLTSPDSRYLAELEPHRYVAPHPVVSYAPALVLRERNRRPFIDAFGQIKHAIEASGEVPEGFRRLVEFTDATADDDGTGQAPDEGEIYFPRVANQQQREVVHRLRREHTVLVQGPPVIHGR